MESTGIVGAYFSPLGRMRMLGGAPALDLANTLHWRDEALADFVPNYEDLVAWCVPAQLLSKAEASLLVRHAKSHREAAQAVHEGMRTLRAALKVWFAASAYNLNHGTPPKPSAHRTVRKAIAKAGGKANLNAIMGLDATDAGEALRLPLQRCATAAAMLVLFPPANDIRQCEADHCGGFFINDSRFKPRRWCSMDGCGNRMKAQRFRLAHKL
jgi:predicted RNA-binding Zn ribbon-like protein